jgi:3-oxosteroid 1-dehydrogenase
MTTTTTSASEDRFDFVIVGSGGGSITAALLAKDAGLRPVIIEKQAKVGGSTGYSGGVVWIPNNPLMAREGVHDSYERARTHFDAVVTYQGPGTTPARREAYLKAGPEMVAYTESKGMRWRRPEGYADYYDDLPGGERRSRMLEPELFDLNELGEWKQRLAIYPGFPFRIYPHELSDLLCAKRTWAAPARGWAGDRGDRGACRSPGADRRTRRRVDQRRPGASRTTRACAPSTGPRPRRRAGRAPTPATPAR